MLSKEGLYTAVLAIVDLYLTCLLKTRYIATLIDPISVPELLFHFVENSFMHSGTYCFRESREVAGPFYVVVFFFSNSAYVSYKNNTQHQPVPEWMCSVSQNI